MSDRASALDAEDAAARERALDVGHSFLVQAPAGSGKTGLLIQRFLALLARVDRPERIVAMTFTRKAAGEMRERIVEALAQCEAPLSGGAHERRTRELAQAALAQDRRHDWRLIAHPSRLAIDTIDAIATAFARQAPLTAGLGAFPRYVDDATDLYVEAARTALAVARPDDSAWCALLAHVDNRADAIVALLAGLLAKRDQWMRELRDLPSREALETTLAHEIEGELARAARALAEHATELAPLLRYAVSHLADEQGSGLRECAAAGGVPTPSVGALAQWKALADWLLVKGEARLRRSADKRLGFPPGVAAPSARDAKLRMEALLAHLDRDPAVAGALDVVRCLPPPRIGADAWAIVESLLARLPRVAAQLTATFAERRETDFVEGALAALRALGAADAPSDLLLRLDGAIEHLLIDEFQDTSVTQLDMIERLTAGWTPGDGRTLFAVGDPMQSIYRFRAAEVRLFVDAQERGRVGDVPVERLTLRRNFRSQSNLVDWVNGTFPAVLGSRNDPLRSIVAFSRASAHCGPIAGVHVTFEALASEADEARRVVEHVERALVGAHDVAILVRTRRHAEPLLPALRQAGVRFAAVELDALGERAVIRDLAALAHALVQPADRLAWLSLLRAPWCGLRAADLLAVACAEAMPLEALRADVEGLSQDGRARLARVREAIGPVLGSRGRAKLAARVRGAWLSLGGPAFADDASDIDAAERFFSLLGAHEYAGDIGDWSAFTGTLARLREADAAPDVRVRVMTLHKAKGLEFDTVVMPALARGAAKSDAQLLLWRRRDWGLLIAPDKARGGERDAVYGYLERLACDEEAAELGRLLYVGCTRAKSRLHLTGVLGIREDGDRLARWRAPPSDSALARLWPLIGDAVAAPTDIEAPPASRKRAALVRVALDWRPLAPQRGLDSPATFEPIAESLPFDWARETARHVGVVVHRLLAAIDREGIAAWDEARVASLAPSISLALAAEGVDAREIDEAGALVQQALSALLGDERGRWLFDRSHEDVRSEWALAGLDGDAIVHVRLDRAFVANGVRWIIDFKTGRHEGGDVEAFLDQERARYAPAMERYARLVRALDPRPIRLALYHPLVRGWREWEAAGSDPR